MNITIVGAGLSGATAAAALLKKGHSVTVFETRDSIGGNCFDYTSNNITVHKYGPHAFHTNSEYVWDFVNKYTKFFPFKLSVYAQIQSGKIIPIPFNNFSKQIVGDWDEQQIINELFKTYSTKHWGVSWDTLPTSIKNRVPKKRNNWYNFYHEDKHQGLPINGYSDMIASMFDGAILHIGCLPDDYKKSKFDLLLYTGSIDQFYNYCYGVLSYRSLDIKFYESAPTDYNQLNKCNTEPETRIIDHSHWYYKTNVKKTIISKEYSTEYDIHDTNTDRFYPCNHISNELYNKYKNIKNTNVIFLGRLGSYKYFDMDACIAHTLSKVNSI